MIQNITKNRKPAISVTETFKVKNDCIWKFKSDLFYEKNFLSGKEMYATVLYFVDSGVLQELQILNWP